MSSINIDDDQIWVPSHVQVTVLRGRGLRSKGKHGTSDVYTIIQVGKEKYSTCVVEKTTSPEWKEECCFELLPGVLEDGERSAYPPGSSDLILTVMHRALIGLDVFLGQAVIPLDKVFQDKICMKNEWYQLNSKTGKKEKERGDIQVTVQFTRNNLTASMYDLSIKGKHRSTFGKLKDRMKGKKRSNEEDTSSAIVPGVSRERSRLPSDGGGEEEYEDDEGGEGRRSKMRNFFLRGKLRKSSDTRSSTSLGSESSESSSRGGSLSPTAGISVVVSDLSNSPSNSSNFTADNSPEHPSETSPKLASHKRAFSYEAGEITIAVPQPTLCVNGTQLYTTQSLEPGSGKPDNSLGQLQKSLPLSMSLQNIRPEGEVLPKGPAGDGRRWSFDKAGKEEKAAIAAALEQTGSVMGKVEEQAAAHTVSAVESDSFFSHGSAGKGASPPKDVSEQAPQRAEEKHKGWFGSKDSYSKPSLTPHVPGLFPWGPPAPPVDPDSLGTLLHHTNPFSHSQTTPPPMSPSNPFLSLLQHNPFFEELSADQALKPALPPLPCLSCRDPWPSVTSPPWSSNPNPILSQDCSASEDSINMDMEEDTMVKVWHRSLPPIPAGEKNPIEPKSSSNPFVSGPGFEKDAEWDDSFEAFAADRLKSPEESPTDYIPQAILVQHRTNYPLEDSKDVGITSLTMNSNKDMNVNYALQPTSLDVTLKACTEDSLTTNKSTVFIEGNSEGTSNVKLSHTETPGTFTQFIDTIPAHQCIEAKVERSTTTDAAANPLELVSGSETKPVNLNTTNTTELTTNAHEATCHICNHSHSYSTQCPSLKDRNMDNSASPGSAAVNNSFERNDAHSNIPGSPEGASNLHTSVKDMVVMKSENVSPLATPLQTESPFSSSGVILDFTAQGLPGVAENDGGEETKSSEVSQEPSSTVQEMTLPQPKMSTMKEMMPDDDPLNKSISVFPDSLIHLVSTDSVSSHSDLNKLCQEDNREGLCKHDMEESFVSYVEEVNDSILTVPDNVEMNIPAISDDENYLIIPSCHIMTSSPGECKSLREAPYGSTSGNQDISQRPPKPARLFSEFLLTDSDIGISPGLGFEDPLLHTKASDQSTSIIHSIYMSADSQHYQTCSSHHSSKCSNVSEEIPPKPRAETLPSANSTPCEDEPSAETGAFESAAGTMSMAVLDQGELSDGCRASNDGNVQSEVLDLFHLGGMFVDQEKTVPLESSLLMGDYPTEPSSQTLYNALTDSFISSQFRDKVTDGVGTDQDDLCSFPQSALQRSLSEGTMRSSFEDLSPSFGSDPGVSLESSSLQHDSGLPPLLSFNPGLTVDRSPSLALSSCPNPPHATVRSSSSAALATAPFSTAKPMIGASQAVLPQETQQAANQQYSPHPVKPLTPSEERRPDGRSVLVSGLEKLKSTIHPGRSSQPTEQEPGRKKSLAEGAGSYYHLTHSELVTLLLQREAELKSQRAVFERQGALLEKRETELRKMKPQVRDLEDYIDTLLVRIMEQTPTLLQVRTKLK